MAAQLETSIEQELLQRLKKGMYGDIYNIHQKVYEKVSVLEFVSEAVVLSAMPLVCGDFRKCAAVVLKTGVPGLKFEICWSHTSSAIAVRSCFTWRAGFKGSCLPHPP